MNELGITMKAVVYIHQQQIYRNGAFWPLSNALLLLVTKVILHASCSPI